MSQHQKFIEIPRRAVPGYLVNIIGCRYSPSNNEAWKDIPPGHRFLLYFHGMADKVPYEDTGMDREQRQLLNKAIENADWEYFRSFNPTITDILNPLQNRKLQALRACSGMGKTGKDLLKAINERLRIKVSQNDWQAEAELISPLATGLGNPHAVENGFAFLTPYGLPYIAGSGVKGVFRRAAEELALFHQVDLNERAGQPVWTLAHVWVLMGFDENSAFFSKPKKPAAPDWLEAYKCWLKKLNSKPCPLLEAWIAEIKSQLPEKAQKWSAPELLRALVQPENESVRRSIHWQGLLSFEDAWPDNTAELMVDIMNPHHKEYYEGKTTPHDAENPVPIFFLALAPGTVFTFQCRALPGRSNIKNEIGDWKTLLDKAFCYAMKCLGIGAKTAVGYGQFKENDQKICRPGSPFPAENDSRAQHNQETWFDAYVTYNSGGGGKIEATTSTGKKADLIGLDNIKKAISESLHNKLLVNKKPIKNAVVIVKKVGNRYEIVKVEEKTN